MASLPDVGTSRPWPRQLGLFAFALALVFGVVEIAARVWPVGRTVLNEPSEIQSPHMLAAKVRALSDQGGKSVVFLGDSLVAGQVLKQKGGPDWHQNTLSAQLQTLANGASKDPAHVLNLGMNGILPADMETLVDALIPTRPTAIVLDVSLRSFSRDFAGVDARYSRPWLKPGLLFSRDGSIVRLPEQLGPDKALERALLNRWTTYRIRDVMRARYFGGDPVDVLTGVRDQMFGSRRAPANPDADEMRLMVQARSRYASADQTPDNPQFAAWTRMLAKLHAAKIPAVVFYATENPRLLPGLIEKERYDKELAMLAQSVTGLGGSLRYVGPQKDLSDEMFLDHVHVDARGYRIYSQQLFAALRDVIAPQSNITPAGAAPAAVSPSPASPAQTSPARTSPSTVSPTGVTALPATPAVATPNAPAPPPAPQRQKGGLDLLLTPFVETISSERTLLGKLTDFSTSATPADTSDKPRIALRDFPVLSIERRSQEPLRDIMFLYNWWDDKGVSKTVRDSYHMLRASVVPLEQFPESMRKTIADRGQPYEYVDLFEGVPSLAGAASFGFYLQDGSMRSATSAQGSLSVFGHRIERKQLPPAQMRVQHGKPESAVTSEHMISLAAVAEPKLSGRGVRFDIQDVVSVYWLAPNHAVTKNVASVDRVIGAMAPQVIGYQLSSNESRVLTFSGTDLLRIRYDADTKTLGVDVYQYEYRERTTRASTAFPDETGVRVHPNLGLVSKLPTGDLRITHALGDVLAFPLWQPNGALASFAITEHADFVGVTQDTVSMYGSDAPVIKLGEGLLGNGIPLTKTIFPAGPLNPFRTRTASSAETNELTQATIASSPPFLDMLRRYKREGHPVEIGIHCVGTAGVAERRTAHVEKALALTAEFKPVVWVDHGGRDCLWESGWDRTSDFYVIPLLRAHGFKYVNMLGDKYDGRISMIADNAPSNLVFKSVGLDDSLDDTWTPVVFNTVPVGFGKNDFDKAHVDSIVKARGFVNLHAYLPYETTQFTVAADGTRKLIVNPWFNDQMKTLAAAQKRGDLHLGTTTELNDYVLKVRGLHVHFDGRDIVVDTPNQEKIQGLTLGYRAFGPGSASDLKVRGVTIGKSRQLDGTTYITLDTP